MPEDGLSATVAGFVVEDWAKTIETEIVAVKIWSWWTKSSDELLTIYAGSSGLAVGNPLVEENFEVVTFRSRVFLPSKSGLCDLERDRFLPLPTVPQKVEIKTDEDEEREKTRQKIEETQERFSKYAAWIKKNSKEYNGNWVVLSQECRLIDSGDDPIKLLRKAWEEGTDQPFLHYIGREEGIKVL